ncbi:hypothetical protein Tco_1541336 [Tanacetum coccineum]
MFVFFNDTPLQNTMAEQNVPNHPPIRTDEQIVPRSQWLTIGKSNLLFNAQKIQKTPYSSDNQWTSLSENLYLSSNNNAIHLRPDSAVHHTGDDYILGNLKFVPKGESVEVFGMAIPDPLITEAIQQSSYYPKYLEMVAENTKKTPQESASVQPATKRATPKKPTTTTPVKQSKPAPPPSKKSSKRKLPQKVRKGKPTFQLVDEDDEAQQESIPQEEDDDPNLDPRTWYLRFLPNQVGAPVRRVTIQGYKCPEATPKLHEVVGKGKAVAGSNPHEFNNRNPPSQPEDDTSEKVIHESSSTSYSERTESETETAAPKGDNRSKEEDTRPDWIRLRKFYMGLSGPNPEHMDDEFLATAYPKVHENLMLITDERVIDDKPESQSGSMSSMKNLDDTFNFGDQFLYDKPTGRRLGRKTKMSHLLSRHHWSHLLQSTQKLQQSQHLSQRSTSSPFTKSGKTGQEILAKVCQESRIKKSLNELISAKKEQDEEKPIQPYSIKSDEEAMIREVADKVKDHKRKHNSDDEKTMMMMKALQLESITRITTQEMLSWTLRCTELIPNQIIPEYNLQMTIPMQDDGNDLIWRDNDNAPTFPRCRLLTRRTTRSGNYSTIILLQQGSGLSSDRIPRREGSQIRIIRGRSQCDSVSRKDVKNLHLNDIEDLFLTQYSRSSPSLPKTDKTSLHTAVNMWIRNLVIRNRVGDLQLGIESYQTKINLERPNWDAADYYFKEDYTIVPKPRAVVYRDINDQRKLMS